MKYNCKKLSVLFAAVMMFVLACPVTVLAAAEEEAGTPAVYATSCGNRSGIDHKRGLQFTVSGNFSWSTSVLWR